MGDTIHGQYKYYRGLPEIYVLLWALAQGFLRIRTALKTRKQRWGNKEAIKDRRFSDNSDLVLSFPQ